LVHVDGFATLHEHEVLPDHAQFFEEALVGVELPFLQIMLMLCSTIGAHDDIYESLDETVILQQ
jgi:hypothetical protein